MDLADEAQRWEEAERAQALARARQGGGGGDLGTASAFVCDACGDDIPEARRQAVKGVRLCTHCANAVERYGRLPGT